jgi:hypothetical protein
MLAGPYAHRLPGLPDEPARVLALGLAAEDGLAHELVHPLGRERGLVDHGHAPVAYRERAVEVGRLGGGLGRHIGQGWRARDKSGRRRNLAARRAIPTLRRARYTRRRGSAVGSCSKSARACSKPGRPSMP